MAARIVRRLIRSLDAAGVIAVFCVPMVLPSGVTRLAGSDTIEPAALRGTVSVLQASGPSDRRPHQVQNLASTTIRLLIRRSLLLLGGFGLPGGLGGL